MKLFKIVFNHPILLLSNIVFIYLSGLSISVDNSKSDLIVNMKILHQLLNWR